MEPRKNFKKTQRAIKSFAFFSFCLFIVNAAIAQGDLLLYPKRIIFEGSKRSQELNLANSGKDTARYVISIVQIRMKEDGTFESIMVPDSGQNFSDKYFRVFPRNVVLPPNESQTVKIQLYNTGELLPGEYRSHLYVRAEDEKRPLGDEEPISDTSSISVKLVAIFGISIPVIIRTGENNSLIRISDVSYQDNKDAAPSLKFTFNRTGNMSVYGDIIVNYISPDGKVIPIANASGLALYTPLSKRNFNLELKKAPGVDFHKGSVQVLYNYSIDKDKRIAEERIALN